MSRLYYDLHIHSCLSPCGDEDMTPNNIVNMAVLNGLQMIALTDHNSCKNCPGLAKAAVRAGIIFVPGMELCVSEEAHVVCLFPDVESAMAFDGYVEKNIPPIKNRPEIFSYQTILNEFDEKIGEFETFLLSASNISVENVTEIVSKFGGIAFPAHIDRASYSVISSLGIIPDEAGFKAAEIFSTEKIVTLAESNPEINKYFKLHNSDAHYLENIAEPEMYIDLPEDTPQALIDFLRNL